MAGNVAVWGIDVGRCALKAIRVRAGGEGQVEIIGHELIEHAEILSQAEGKKSALVTEAMEKFLSRHDISRDRIVVGVPGQHTLSRFSKLPPVEPKKIPDIVRYEADQQIPFDLDEVIWDYQTFQEPDSPDVEVGIFAMKRELIRDHLLPFEQAGIEPVAVQSTPLALYNAMMFEERIGDATVVLLDVGAENTDLIVAQKHGLWTRTIPLGGNKFTDVLVKSFKLSFAKAENLKRTAATSKYARQVFQAMRPVFAELVQELSRSLGFYRSTHREAVLKRIVGLGNAFQLPGLQKYLQQNLQMPVERPTTFQQATTGDVGDAAAFAERVPGYFVAFGLGIQGLDVLRAATVSVPIKSNLLPPQIVKQVIWRKKRPFFAAAAACLGLAAGVIWFRQASDLSTLASGDGDGSVEKITFARAGEILKTGVSGNQAPRAEAQVWLEVAKAFEAEMNKYRNEGATEVQRADEIIQLQRQKAVWPRILAMIHASLPKPAEALAEAKTPDALVAAIQANPTELDRPRRNQLFIERFRSEYSDNVDAVELLDVERNDSGEDVIEGEKGQPRKGFLITLRCRTPNAGRFQFVDETIKQGLRTKGREKGSGIYVNRVVLTSARGFLDKEEDKPAGGRPPPGRGGRGRDKPPPTAPRGDAKIDPLTDESMEQDWVF
ncbi:MAG: type IV pilus assembly protein PilM, partial [Phycisphaerales bacterium]|nr:type IV pilus assembly protein PilM [Phycisphaerales bacterium]